MLSQQLLDLLRRWWRSNGHGIGCFLAGRPVTPHRAAAQRRFHAAARRAGIDKRVGFTPCAIASPRICSNGRPTSASFRCFWATRSSTPRRLYPCRHQGDRRGHQPARPAAHPGKTARLIAPFPCHAQRSRCGSSAATVRYGARQRRTCEPRATEGHVGHRGLPQRTGRACRALRGLLACAHRLQLLPQPALPEVPRRSPPRNGWPTAKRSCCRFRTTTSCSRCRPRSATSPTKTRPSSTASCSMRGSLLSSGRTTAPDQEQQNEPK